MKKTTKTSIIRFTYIGITVLVIILIGTFDKSFQNFGEILKSINIFWILIAFIFMLLYWLSDAWLLGDITSYLSENKLNFKKSLKIGIIGLYYSALTPSATGGQPAQIVYMKRENIPIGTSTCIVLIKFVAYSLTVIVYYLLSSIIFGKFYFENYQAAYWLSLLGFILNSTAIAVFLITVINEKIILKMGNAVIRFLHRIKIIKNIEKANINFTKTIDDYTSTAKYMTKNKMRMLGSFFISFINIGFLFAITYFIYRAFGLTENSFINIMCLQSLLYVAVSYFPAPGAAGASEGGFYAIFIAFFSKNMIFTAMLLWRFMTYYIVLIAGSLLVVFDEVAIIRKKAKELKTVEKV